jgi:photosystem II stability/assembly factor-like uncharacterized protein/sugar lactone lactonase YvrE
MKNIFCIFLLLSLPGFSQFNIVTEVHEETDGGIVDFQMVDENVGYIVLHNQIKRTSDGGNTWNTVFTANLPLTVYRDLLFTDTNTGFLLTNFEILKTKDGGQTWVTKFLDSPTSSNVAYFNHRKISMNGNIGFVGVNSCATNEPSNSGCSKWYLKTTDGGETWSKVFTPSNFFSFEAINCDDPTELFAFNVARQSFGPNGSLFNGVYKSTDNGLNWQSVTPLQNVFHYDVKRFNNKKYYSATIGLNQDATSYFISKSIETPSLTNLDLSEYAFIDNSTHFALGKSATVSGFQNHIYRTNDEGKTWFFIDDNEVTGYIKQNYKFLQSVNNRLWLISESNKIYKLNYQKVPAKDMQVVPIVGIDNPNGIALNAQKQIFFTEYDNNTVRRYDPATQLTTTVAGGNGRGTSPSTLYDPTGIEVIGNDMYIVNFFGNTIQKWTVGNTSGTIIAGGSRANGDGTYTRLLYRPNDVAIDNLGDLYIVSSWEDRIVKWTPGAADGVTLLGGNGNGSGANQFRGPVGITRLADGTIYVVDVFNHRIQKFLPGQTNGITVAGNGLEGNNTKRLNRPVSVQVATDGAIYVLESGNNRITKWTEGNPKGEIVLGNLSAGNALNQMNYPRDFVFDESTQTFYIADAGNNRILTYTLHCSGENPTATISGNQTINRGETSTVSVDLTGTPPYNLVIAHGSFENRISYENIQSSPFTLSVSPQSTTEYTITSVSNRCQQGTFSGKATVNVVVPNCNSIDATLTGQQTIREGEIANLTITTTGDLPYSITINGTSFNNINVSNYTLGLSPTLTTNYTISNISNTCGSGTAQGNIKVSVIPNTYCPEEILFDTGLHSGGEYIVGGKIESKAFSLARFSYSAGESILLLPGFEVKDNVFLAKIEGCISLPPIPTNGLIMYLPLNGNGNDATGNNNNALLDNVAFNTDRFGNPSSACSFFGYNVKSALRIPNSNSTQFSNSFSLSIWYYQNTYAGMDGYGWEANNGYQMLFAKEGDWAGFYAGISSNPALDSVSYNFTNAGNFNTNVSIKSLSENVNKWVHMVYVAEADKLKIFKNGLKIKETALIENTNFTTANTRDLYFGRYSYYWYPFDGKMDDIRMYNRALSDTEVTTLFNAEK